MSLHSWKPAKHTSDTLSGKGKQKDKVVYTMNKKNCDVFFEQINSHENFNITRIKDRPLSKQRCVISLSGYLSLRNIEIHLLL